MTGHTASSSTGPLRFSVTFASQGIRLRYDCTLSPRGQDVAERYVLQRRGQRDEEAEQTVETIDEMIADLRDRLDRRLNSP